MSIPALTEFLRALAIVILVGIIAVLLLVIGSRRVQEYAVPIFSQILGVMQTEEGIVRDAPARSQDLARRGQDGPRGRSRYVSPPCRKRPERVAADRDPPRHAELGRGCQSKRNIKNKNKEVHGLPNNARIGIRPLPRCGAGNY